MEPEGLCSVVPEGLCAVVPEGLCFGVPEGLCVVVPEGLLPEGLCAVAPEGSVRLCPKDFVRWCPKDFVRWCPRDFVLVGWGAGFVWGCVNVCWVLGSGDLWCFSPPLLSGGSALSCDRAGRPPFVPAGSVGGRLAGVA
eukprot:COSAG01_NODE_98_length_26629_cov_56.866453_2_plen_139_part_00